MPVEVANILRRAELSAETSSEVVALAHADLLRLAVELVGYEPCASRVWELRWSL